MRKTFNYLMLIAFASFGFVSCEKEEENEPTADSEIVGVWEGDADEYHYPIATINSDGTYEWEWAGIARFKDVGKYTYENNRIVMKPSTYYEWDDEKKGYVVNKEPWDNSPRTIRILDINPGVMRVNLNDYFMGGGQGEGFDFVLYRKGLSQKITKNDLQGTWEYYESDGSLSQRVVISGSSYTAYEIWTSDSILCAEKSTGTWSVDNGILTVDPDDIWFSYERVNYDYVYSTVDPVTLEAENWTRAGYDLDSYKEKVYLTEDKKTLYAAGKVFVKK